MEKIAAGQVPHPEETFGPEILRRADGKVYPHDSVGAVMTRAVVAVPAEASLRETAIYMRGRNIHSVIVKPDASGQWGIMTMRDVLKKVVREGRAVNGLTVGDLTSRPLLSVSPETPIAECAALMVERNIRRLAVVENGEPIGIISETDIFSHVAE
ncbi:cyclic nucleotide-binding/CBS domain-containing protein [Chloroflexus islandicus]